MWHCFSPDRPRNTGYIGDNAKARSSKWDNDDAKHPLVNINSSTKCKQGGQVHQNHSPSISVRQGFPDSCVPVHINRLQGDLQADQTGRAQENEERAHASGNVSSVEDRSKRCHEVSFKRCGLIYYNAAVSCYLGFFHAYFRL